MSWQRLVLSESVRRMSDHRRMWSRPPIPTEEKRSRESLTALRLSPLWRDFSESLPQSDVSSQRRFFTSRSLFVLMFASDYEHICSFFWISLFCCICVQGVVFGSITKLMGSRNTVILHNLVSDLLMLRTILLILLERERNELSRTNLILRGPGFEKWIGLLFLFLLKIV